MVERHDRVSVRGQIGDQAGIERDRGEEAAREQQHTAHVPVRGRGVRRVGIDVEQAGGRSHTQHSDLPFDEVLDGCGEIRRRRSVTVPGGVPDPRRDGSRSAGPRLSPGEVEHVR
jgi:hypothetical protein